MKCDTAPLKKISKIVMKTSLPKTCRNNLQKQLAENLLIKNCGNQFATK